QNYFDHKAQFLGIENYTEEGFAHMHRAVPLVLAVFKQALRRPKLRVVFGTDAVAGAFGKNWEELIYRVQVGGQAPMAAIVSPSSRSSPPPCRRWPRRPSPHSTPPCSPASGGATSGLPTWAAACRAWWVSRAPRRRSSSPARRAGSGKPPTPGRRSGRCSTTS